MAKQVDSATDGRLTTAESPPKTAKSVGPAARKRGRPRKFTRDQLVDLAIKLIDEQGYERLTLRGLARRVGVIPPTLYRYFEDFDDLTLAVTDRLLPLAPSLSRSSRETPREQIVDYLLASREALLRHPETLLPPIGSAGWRRQIKAFDAVLELLSGLPQSPESLLIAFEALGSAVYFGAEQERRYGAGNYRRALAAAVSKLPPGEAPRLRAAYRSLVSSKPDQRKLLVRWLNKLIDQLLPGIDDLPARDKTTPSPKAAGKKRRQRRPKRKET